MKQMQVSVFGAGSWGSVLAHVLAENGHDVLLWTRHSDQAQEINQQHRNSKYLKEASLSNNIRATSQLEEAIDHADIYLVVIPTAGIRELMRQINERVDRPKLIIHASKGLEQVSHKRISTMIEEEMSADNLEAIVVLSGPSHAEEVIRKDLTSITAASSCQPAREQVQDLFMNDYFRVYTNADVIGVELGGALKNIIALGSGIAAGIGLGDNAKAALITRGLAEITRFGTAMGAEESTFMGLSGVGDLVVTAMSPHSRNYQCGYLIGQGHSPQQAVEEVGMVVEGFYTTQAVSELAHEKEIDMPITQGIQSILKNGQFPQTVIQSLMRRSGKEEK